MAMSRWGWLPAQQLLHATDIGSRDDLGAVQTTSPAGGLVLEQMATVRLLTQQLAFTGHLESLRGAAVALHLRHGILISVVRRSPGDLRHLNVLLRTGGLGALVRSRSGGSRTLLRPGGLLR